MKSVLVLSSGGLDSSVVIALYTNLGYKVHTLYIDYGNTNKEAELISLNAICDKFDVDFFNRHMEKVYISWSNGGAIDKTNSNPYIEMRNLIFLSYAISMAEAKEIDEIAVGFIKVPVDYADTTQNFLDNINTLSVESIGVSVCAPIKELDKAGVYRLGKKLGISLKDTFSCNYSDTKPCGRCADCQDTLELIESENIPDEENPFK